MSGRVEKKREGNEERKQAMLLGVMEVARVVCGRPGGSVVPSTAAKENLEVLQRIFEHTQTLRGASLP